MKQGNVKALLPIGVIFGLNENYDISDRTAFISLICICVIAILMAVGFTFLTIGMQTEEARVYADEFEAQKNTIEQSLESDILTGLERIELVKLATEANRDLAKKKATMRLWYYVYFDETIYDHLEPINLNVGG